MIIEHDVDEIRSADHIIDLGPVGGEKGVISSMLGHRRRYQNTPHQQGKFSRNTQTTNGSSTSEHVVPDSPTKTHQENHSTSKNKDIRINGATLHNLKNINARFPSDK